MNSNSKYNRRRNQRQPQKQRKSRSFVAVKDFASHRIKTSNVTIPEYKRNPAVQRVVRLEIPASTSAAFNVTGAKLAQQDGTDYGLTSPAVRYTKLRAESIRVYLDSSNLAPSSTLTVQNADGDSYVDTANPGSTILSVGIFDSLNNRSNVIPTTASDNIYAIIIDSPITDTTVTAYAYVMCLFS
jgi:hypothetical protein